MARYSNKTIQCGKNYVIKKYRTMDMTNKALPSVALDPFLWAERRCAERRCSHLSPAGVVAYGYSVGDKRLRHGLTCVLSLITLEKKKDRL